ncbi:unnamed protein product, partial [Pleuronectes platessa]
QCQCSDSHNPSSTPISSSPEKNIHHPLPDPDDNRSRTKVAADCLTTDCYSWHPLHFCPSWKRDPSHAALPEGSHISSINSLIASPDFRTFLVFAGKVLFLGSNISLGGDEPQMEPPH